MTKRLLKSAVWTLLLVSSASFAQSRGKSRFGLAMGILSDPAPSIIAYQAKLNLTEWLQIHVGYGSITATGSGSTVDGVASSGSGTVTTMGAGAKIFLLSGGNFSPYVGGGYSLINATGDFAINGQTIATGSGKLSSTYASVGLDHQANIGFNIGAGVHYFFTPTELKTVVKYLPHVYFGWFF